LFSDTVGFADARQARGRSDHIAQPILAVVSC
jgi:hypothetical protein